MILQLLASAFLVSASRQNPASAPASRQYSGRAVAIDGYGVRHRNGNGFYTLSKRAVDTDNDFVVFIQDGAWSAELPEGTPLVVHRLVIDGRELELSREVYNSKPGAHPTISGEYDTDIIARVVGADFGFDLYDLEFAWTNPNIRDNGQSHNLGGRVASAHSPILGGDRRLAPWVRSPGYAWHEIGVPGRHGWRNRFVEVVQLQPEARVHIIFAKSTPPDAILHVSLIDGTSIEGSYRAPFQLPIPHTTEITLGALQPGKYEITITSASGTVAKESATLDAGWNRAITLKLTSPVPIATPEFANVIISLRLPSAWLVENLRFELDREELDFSKFLCDAHDPELYYIQSDQLTGGQHIFTADPCGIRHAFTVGGNSPSRIEVAAQPPIPKADITINFVDVSTGKSMDGLHVGWRSISAGELRDMLFGPLDLRSSHHYIGLGIEITPGNYKSTIPAGLTAVVANENLSPQISYFFAPPGKSNRTLQVWRRKSLLLHFRDESGNVTFDASPEWYYSIEPSDRAPGDSIRERAEGMLVEPPAPGTYTITFHHIPGHVAPAPIEFTISNENLEREVFVKRR
ncbi:MAG: hypothetical protein HY286_03180 [Planctomycetes bacterium]|nr:hypothetical protein [Planctomycetota bacterium]